MKWHGLAVKVLRRLLATEKTLDSISIGLSNNRSGAIASDTKYKAR